MWRADSSVELNGNNGGHSQGGDTALLLMITITWGVWNVALMLSTLLLPVSLLRIRSTLIQLRSLR